LKASGIFGLTLITLEFGLIIEIMVVVVYWPWVHPSVLEEILPLNDSIIYWTMIWIHIWPFIAMVVNVGMSKTVFIYRHYQYVVVLGIIYAVTNFIGTKIKGKPLYPFLLWEDWTSIVVMSGLILVGVGFYLTVCYVVNSLKRVKRFDRKIE
jgi:hypothetical protein